MKYQYVLLVLIFQSAYLFGQDGQLDLSFGISGIVTTQISDYDDYCFDVAIQPDGKIVAVGQSQNYFNKEYCVVRYNPDGNIDLGFGVNGIIKGDFGFGGYNIATCVEIVNDKVLVAGWGYAGFNDNSFVVRFNDDGTPDSSFGTNGWSIIVYDTISYLTFRFIDMAIQQDGKIVLAAIEGTSGGDEDFAVVRLTSDGIPDSSFDNDGRAITQFYPFYTDGPSSVILDASGKIVTAGLAYQSSALVRYNSDGTLDESFGTGGKIESDTLGWGNSYTVSVALAPNSKILIACTTEGVSFKVARFNDDGTLDSTFGVNGLAEMDVEGYAMAMSVQEDNKIVLAGAAYGNIEMFFGIGRFLPNGDVDSTFGSNGFVTTEISSFCYARASAIQPDGKIIAAGQARKNANYAFALARYNSSFDSSIAVGTTSNCFPVSAEAVYPNPVKFSTILKYTLKEKASVSIELFDLNGRFIDSFQQNEVEETGEHVKRLTLSKKLSDGNYILRILTGSSEVTTIITKE
jgi:uncharacterized delta-60 repeat protein